LDGHEVRVASGVGGGVGHVDTSWLDVGAIIVAPDEAWDADLIVKVKEAAGSRLPATCVPGRRSSASITSPASPRARAPVAASGITAIAFEMVRDAAGGFPLLAPMSEIAGRMALDVAARHLGCDRAKCWCWARATPGARRSARPWNAARASPCCAARRRARKRSRARPARPTW
jgi:alanine dehydrogenase